MHAMTRHQVRTRNAVRAALLVMLLAMVLVWTVFVFSEPNPTWGWAALVVLGSGALAFGLQFFVYGRRD